MTKTPERGVPIDELDLAVGEVGISPKERKRKAELEFKRKTGLKIGDEIEFQWEGTTHQGAVDSFDIVPVGEDSVDTFSVFIQVRNRFLTGQDRKNKTGRGARFSLEDIRSGAIPYKKIK